MRRAHVLLLASSIACSTLGTEGEGDRDLPNAGAGPFRKLDSDEVQGVAPFVFDSQPDRYREPAALAEGDDVALYVVAFDRATSSDVIVRTRAKDGRSFFGANIDTGHTAPIVLSPTLPWEGAKLSGPSPIRVGGEIWLYYAASDGTGNGAIGVAKSTDGVHFTKNATPVLAAATGTTLEATPLSGPSVLRLENGHFRMFYASGCAIFEAESSEGETFQRVDPVATTAIIEPVLGVAAPKEDLLPGERPPFDTSCVGDPHVTRKTTAAGRSLLRVLYTGTREMETAIGFAARYGDTGILTRNELPTFAIGAGVRAPTTWEHAGRLFLYVGMNKVLDKDTFPVIGAGVSPVKDSLGMPSAFPPAP